MESEGTLKKITRNLQEVLGSDKLIKIIEQRPLKLYWGTATTGKPHLAYFVPISKIADFLSAGCEVTILIADLHGYLDNAKSPWDLLNKRSLYYEHVIKAMLISLNVPVEKLKFVTGSSFQLEKNYVTDLLKLLTVATEHDCKKASSEVVKQVKYPLMSGLVYPVLQALDEEYLQVDAQFGGVDQRKIFTFAEEYLPLLGYEKRIHLMNPMVPGLAGSKMSSSDESSKIDLLDSTSAVSKKIKKAFCEEGNIENNGLLSFCKHVIFPVFNHHQTLKKFILKRDPKYGESVEYNNYEDLEKDFAQKIIHPGDLKSVVIEYVEGLLSPVREYFSSSEMMELVEAAYPSSKPKLKIGKILKERSNDISPAYMNMKVGKILSVNLHPEVKTSYILEVDVGEMSPRNVSVSLVDHFNSKDLKGKMAVILCNLKPYDLNGVTINGMAFAASFENVNSGNSIDLLKVPDSCVPGDEIFVEGYDKEKCYIDVSSVTDKVQKYFKKLLVDFEVNEYGVVTYKSRALLTHKGPVVSSLNNGTIN